MELIDHSSIANSTVKLIIPDVDYKTSITDFNPLSHGPLVTVRPGGTVHIPQRETDVPYPHLSNSVEDLSFSIDQKLSLLNMAHLESSKLFSVKGLVAVVTGGGSGQYKSPITNSALRFSLHSSFSIG